MHCGDPCQVKTSKEVFDKKTDCLRPKLMPATARAMLGLATPLPQPKLPPNPQHQEQPLGGEKKESGNEVLNILRMQLIET